LGAVEPEWAGVGDSAGAGDAVLPCDSDAWLAARQGTVRRRLCAEDCAQQCTRSAVRSTGEPGEEPRDAAAVLLVLLAEAFSQLALL